MRNNRFEKNTEYLVFHFYIPDYNLQGTLFAIPMRYFQNEGYRKTVIEARNRFLSRFRGSGRRISPKLLRLWGNKRINYDVAWKRMPERVAQFYNEHFKILHNYKERPT